MNNDQCMMYHRQLELKILVYYIIILKYVIIIYFVFTKMLNYYGYLYCNIIA